MFAKSNIEKNVKERAFFKIIKNILNVCYIYGSSMSRAISQKFGGLGNRISDPLIYRPIPQPHNHWPVHQYKRIGILTVI